MKKIGTLAFLGVVCMVLVFMLTSCIMDDANIVAPNLLTYCVHPLDKAFSKAVEHNGLIYYYSNENGIYGIYSMKNDGSDVQLLAEAADVTKIRISDGRLYFSSISEMKERSKNSNAIHMIYVYDFDSKQSGLLNIPEKRAYLRDKYDYISELESVNNFDLSSNSQYIIIYEQLRILWEYLSLYKTPDNTLALEDLNGIPINILNRQCVLFTIDGNCFLYNYPLREINSKYGLSYEPNIIDLASGKINMNDYYAYSDDVRILASDNKYIFASTGNQISVFNIQRKKEEKVIRIDSTETAGSKIRSIYAHDGVLYVLTWKLNSNRPYAKVIHEALYKVDIKSNQVSEISSFGGSQRILFYNDEYIIQYRDGKIYLVTMDDSLELNERQQICSAPSDFINGCYRTEIAGDWIFVYKTYYSSLFRPIPYPITHLDLRVNYKTNTVIKNEQKVDYNIYDKYRNR